MSKVQVAIMIVIFPLILTGCVSVKKKLFQDPSTVYQQCNGLRQQSLALNSGLMVNNLNSFEVQQQQVHIRDSYNRLGCDQVLRRGRNGTTTTPAK